MAGQKRAELEGELTRLASEIAGASSLDPFFTQCRAENLFALFREADRKADRLQFWHRLLAGVAAWAGSLALILGLLQLGLPALHGMWLFWSEVVLIALTFIAVFVGWIFDRHKAWLLWRFRAEHYRLLIFRLLADPRFWATGKPEERSLTPEKVGSLAELELDALARKDPSLSDPFPLDSAPTPPAALLPFYRRARLHAQIEYFQGIVEKEESKFFSTNRRLAPVFLFTGVLFVVAHLVVDLAAEQYGRQADWKPTSVFLLSVSAMWPAAYAGIRTWRSANEYSRNAARAKAKLGVLAELESALEKEKESPGRAFALLAVAEGLLEAEQREWLRLMLDAEWF